MSIIQIIQGDILTANTDVIVNPANSHLAHGGGLAAIIAKAAAGPASLPSDPFRPAEAHEWWNREQRNHPLIATGDAGWTSAGVLRQFKGIIHAVGPVWGGGQFHEDTLLRSAYFSALRVASEHGCTSVAFPAISAGIFGVPIDVVSRAALGVAKVSAHGLGINRVAFYLFEDAHYAEFEKTAGFLRIGA